MDKYTVSQYSVNSILGFIEAGEIAIPEIQRPFVWKPRQVRDLVDSLYNGFPTGYLITWQNPDVKLKDGSKSAGKKVLIDGQQRVTALMTAIAGHKVLNDSYEEKVYRIAFNPLAKTGEEIFAVQTPIHLNSTNWIPDISKIFKADFDSYSFIQEYIEKNPGVAPAEINAKLTRLASIGNCQIGVISLAPDLDIGEVTEIFVRINSQGKILNEADFAMSKIAADEKNGGNMLRKAIDYFCHLAVDPSFFARLAEGDTEFMKSKYANKLTWLKNVNDDIYDPEYNDMLRVSFMHKFGRGKLGDLVSLLSGRDFTDRTYKEEVAIESFKKLDEGVMNFMNQYDFEQFVLTIRSAGFVNSSMLSSQMTLDFAYTLYLLLQHDNNFPKLQIKSFIQKWFVLSTLTGRYVGSPETQMDRDLRGIEEKGFLKFLEENEAALLSESFWTVNLPQRLETSAISSPYLNVFLAAQVFFNDKSLLSNSSTVTDLITVRGDVHHIFPKEYLKQNNYNDKSRYNQIANYAYLDTGVNISIGKSAPNDYFSKALEQCTTKGIAVGTITDENLFWDNLKANCIPKEIVSMTAEDYPEFLTCRRNMMAKKIERYYKSL